MKPGLKNGLIAGSAGLIAGACLTFGASGLCGPGVALLVGALAGHFTAREERPATPREGARLGAISGGIAGGPMLLIGALRVLSLPAQIQALPVPPEVELSPAPYFFALAASALVTVLGLALANVLFAAFAGAAAGYVFASQPASLAQGDVSLPQPAPAGIVSPRSARKVEAGRPAVWRQGLKFGLIFGGALGLVMSLSVVSYGGVSLPLGALLASIASNFAFAIGLFTLVGITVVWVWRQVGRLVTQAQRR
jgi:hypothetical protein